ncbi:hypothetical protein MKY41_01470 [Sporosarcina sp. FSL W7-1349]|uniref:hypothetical protein n=1 Tax=Sporosarcina sp. FSL W7-1349 TaxID=2921561 RepID=UPI0030F84306
MKKNNRLKDSTFIIIDPLALLAAIGGGILLYGILRNKFLAPAMKKILSESKVQALLSEK